MKIPTFTFIGESNSGKTSFAILPAKYEALEFLNKFVGDGNLPKTKCEHTFVYTTGLFNVICVKAKLNANLSYEEKEFFFKHFSKDTLDSQGYYEHRIYIERPGYAEAADFVRDFFYNPHNKFYLENLCKDLIICVPMGSECIDILMSNPQLHPYFKFGPYYEFRVVDTLGILNGFVHLENSEQYCMNVIKNCDALAMFLPMQRYTLDSYTPEEVALFTDIINKSKFDGTLFVLNSKLDKFVKKRVISDMDLIGERKRLHESLEIINKGVLNSRRGDSFSNLHYALVSLDDIVEREKCLKRYYPMHAWSEMLLRYARYEEQRREQYQKMNLF